MANDEQNSENLKKELEKVFKAAMENITSEDVTTETVPLVASCTDAKHGDYQCNNAMSIWKKIGDKSKFALPLDVGKAIMANLPDSDLIESSSVAGPGFVNVKISNSWIANNIQKMLIDGIQSWAPILPIRRAIVDFSSPNIAKEMHVGHLRSTIIGDSIARMLEHSNVQVLRRNHVGDWGTQFGMLIEFLFDKFPNWEDAESASIGDIQELYKLSKARFDDKKDEDFKKRARKAVVRLQSGEAKYREAWTHICEVSRREFVDVYQRLNIELDEKGESFYNPLIPRVLNELNQQGLITEDEGAQVIAIDGMKIPLIVVKSDGGYNYASTDLAALWYRINVEEAEWIVYVTDVGQQQHFDMVFDVAKRAGWLSNDGHSYPKASHVGFGLVLGEDGKRFRTRSTEVVKLADLLDEAKTRSRDALNARVNPAEWTEEELDQTAEAIGYGAVKYADLKNSRWSNYKFSYDQMLNDKGNSAVFLLYTHARVCSIIRKSNKDLEELKKTEAIFLDHPSEHELGLHLIRFREITEQACTSLMPNILCEYLYSLSEKFTAFYSNCKVKGSPEETSRLLLCEATGVVMRKCFFLLGITPIHRI